ncbi:MAG: hypothetical protein WC702_04715 [Patescibacteria group bacterium]|jgi:hypothetical protein
MTKRIIVTAVLFFCLVGAIFCSIKFFFEPKQPELGVTFSAAYAYGLGLDPREAYIAVLEDLGVRKIRLPIYWSQIETEKGQYDWSLNDFFVNEAEKRGVELILVIGNKVPRWPECYTPDWAEGLVGSETEAAVLNMEKTVVERYKDSPAVERWQVENEPFFPFGICPSPSAELLDKEISLVKSLDNKPIMLTVSGELDPWIPSAKISDVLGISMYRVSYSPATGLMPYPLKPLVYRFRAMVAGLFTKEIIISELQAEPWFSEPINELSGEERAEAFTSEDLADNISFAKYAGFSEAYLWGVEWWYAEKELGRTDLWTAGKLIFGNEK